MGDTSYSRRRCRPISATCSPGCAGRRSDAKGVDSESQLPACGQGRFVRHTFERFARVLVWSTILGVVGALAAAQSTKAQQQSPQQPPRFRTEANFVRVDAYPLKDGKPVLDLNADEFEIQEDGVPQKIDTFEH